MRLFARCAAGVEASARLPGRKDGRLTARCWPGARLVWTAPPDLCQCAANAAETAVSW
jgi:hypothetical protein